MELVGLTEDELCRVLEAATMSAFGALADRASAQAFHYLFGVWPGEKREKAQSR